MVRFKWLVYVCCYCLFTQSVLVEAGAVSVADEAKNIGAEEQGLAQQALEEARAAAELEVARQELVTANQALDIARRQTDTRAQSVAEAEINVVRAQAKLAAAEDQARLATELAFKAKAAADAAKTDAEWARQMAASALQHAEKSSLVAQTDDEDAQVERNYQQADALDSAADTKLNRADQLKDANDEAVQAALDAGEQVRDSKDEWQDSLNQLTDAKVAADDAALALMDAKTARDEAHKVVDELQRQRALFTPSKSLNLEYNVYHWNDDQGNHGYQLMMPYNFYYAGKNMEYGLSTAYMISSYSTAGVSGRVSAWADTVLSAAYKTNHTDYPLRYSVAVNVPTGKSKLFGDEKRAIMDDDLVQQSTFGEGFNVTPEVSVSHPIGKEDMWILAMNYSWRGKYTQDGDLPNGTITPGDSWGQRLRWQHIGRKWQLIGELKHFSYTNNQLGGLNTYRQGDEWDTSLTYNRDLGQGKSVMLYYRNMYDQAYTAYDATLAQYSNSISSHYYGWMWSNRYDSMHTFRISGDFMKRNGNSFDPHTNLYIDGRTKYTGGIGYDLAWTPTRALSLDVQWFYMQNGTATDASSNTGYHGYNLLLRYAYSF